MCARISAESGSPPRIKSGQAIFRKTLKRPADQGYASSSRLIAAISESVGRPRLIAEALNFVGGRRLREAKMLLPSLRRIGEIGVDVGAMKDVAGPARQRRKRADIARLVVPDETPFSERHPARSGSPGL